MRGLRILVALIAAVLFGKVGLGRADEHLRFPGEVPVDIYHSGGPIGSLTDGRWVVIPFWRPLDTIPTDHNLLQTFDEDAIDLPLLVNGFARLRDGLPPSWEARGNAVPFVFVRETDFLEAVDDHELTIAELLRLPSTRLGTASFYQEQNHIFGIHPVSHYAMVARGRLKDGRTFRVQFVEVDLVLIQTKVVFR